jgi:pyruvate/2-oxoglutarate dehydrogenase complex dihydrolipoamide acyltransferase (E2) component
MRDEALIVSDSPARSLVDVVMPQMGVSVSEGTVIEWKHGVGDHVQIDETVCEISTDKIDTDVPAPASGVLAAILVEVEQTVPVGTALARIETEEPSPAPSRPSTSQPPEPHDPPSATAASSGSIAVARQVSGMQEGRQDVGGATRYTPVVQRLAAEHDLDLAKVSGTGRDGRVTKQDVLAFLESPTVPGRRQPEPAMSPIDGPAGVSVTSSSSSALAGARSAVAQRVAFALATAALCQTWIEVDLSRVEEARRTVGAPPLAFVARATIDALRAVPGLNAWLDGDRWTLHDEVNLGIGQPFGDAGLDLPVIHRAQELSIEGLTRRIGELDQPVHAHTLAPDDTARATFTIASLGGDQGVLMTTAILNPPQVAMLTVGAVTKKPVVGQDAYGNDAIAIRPMTILGLAWDHRALDGALAAQFLASVKQTLEAPWTGTTDAGAHGLAHR